MNHHPYAVWPLVYFSVQRKAISKPDKVLSVDSRGREWGIVAPVLLQYSITYYGTHGESNQDDPAPD